MAAGPIILFHSMYGLTPDVYAAAERLRAAGTDGTGGTGGSAGYEVHTPDLFDGRTAATMEGGRDLRDAVGRDELLKRAVAAAAPFAGRGPVYAGFSLGGAIAQNLALADEQARGLLLLHGTSDIADDASVDGLPVQLHVADPDPFEPHDWLTAWYLRMQGAGADVEVHHYPGAGHLYTHSQLDDYDEEAAERTWRTAIGFLESL